MAQPNQFAEHLLPPNASPLMETLAAAGARLQRLPVPLDLLKRPYETPDGFVPLLAWERAVALWNGDWSQSRKRNVIDASLRLHFKLGTAKAIREYVRYCDGEVIRIERPPSRVFSGPALTREEREAWLSKLPQVRVWTFREAGTAAAHKAFLGGRSGRVKSRRFYMAAIVATPSTARDHMGLKARWVVRGKETDERVTEFGSHFQLHLRSSAGRRVMCDRPFARRYFVPSEAWRRLVTIAPKAISPWRIAVGPTLQAVQAEPERIAEHGIRGRGVFSGSVYYRSTGSFLRRNYFVPTTAPMRLFDRYPVFDGSVGLKRPNVQFMGTGRYGAPAHSAIIHVSIPGRRSRHAAGEGITTPGARYWLPSNPEPFQRVRNAISLAKRLSDKLLLQSGPIPRFVADKPFLAGIDKFVVGRP
ncbi:phage tail P2-like protein [Rhodopseudomonas faecalis]|uniref:Phage tail P2-like protein n=1 Tax=Rhodopseudomonas faecalis TaxID=99655 RepID=A0A318TZG7_9BRAD|nr:phage tail protein I [Rhodopseudomonas faecalis]PYF05039.1 phage tail P2-like protein [Rhodopseudomonas faecalis]